MCTTETNVLPRNCKKKLPENVDYKCNVCTYCAPLYVHDFQSVPLTPWHEHTIGHVESSLEMSICCVSVHPAEQLTSRLFTFYGFILEEEEESSLAKIRANMSKERSI